MTPHDTPRTDERAGLSETNREVAESMTRLWQAERERADRLEAMCDRMAGRLAEMPDLWLSEGRSVMFNRAGDDLSPQARVGRWLADKCKPADYISDRLAAAVARAEALRTEAVEALDSLDPMCQDEDRHGSTIRAHEVRGAVAGLRSLADVPTSAPTGEA